MLEYIPQIISFLLYLVWGACTYRALCKLVWVSNDFAGPACDYVEKWFVRLFVIACWPIVILFMAD